MALTLVLVAGSAMADGGGIVTSGGRTDDTGQVGSGCCAVASQNDGGLVGSGGGLMGSGGREDGGILGSGGGAQTQDGGVLGPGGGRQSRDAKQREIKREFRFLGFLFAIFD